MYQDPILRLLAEMQIEREQLRASVQALDRALQAKAEKAPGSERGSEDGPDIQPPREAEPPGGGQ